MVSDSQCQAKLEVQFCEDEMICAGILKYGSPNICNGDSGGPLICHKNGQTILTGVASFGVNSCLSDNPMVFARVSTYIEWIRDNMEKKPPKYLQP